MASTYVKTGNVAERKIRGKRILVPLLTEHPRIDSVYNLNEMASLIMDLAGRGLTDEQIASEVAREYDVDEQTARSDAGEVLDELVRIGALKREEGGK